MVNAADRMAVALLSDRSDILFCSRNIRPNNGQRHLNRLMVRTPKDKITDGGI